MSRTLKRVGDVVVATLSLLVLSSLLLILALLIRLRLGAPVIFRQERPGKDGKTFQLVKFRTMSDARDQQGNLLPDEQRLTPLGRSLRRFSLDELPQLWNVLKGDMSLVGPRPLLIEYLGRYSLEQARRHLVKPGITGWAQINGRNAVNWDERFRLDVWYVDHWSLWLDLRILASTFWHVLKGEGISREGHATMPKFMGNEQSKS